MKVFKFTQQRDDPVLFITVTFKIKLRKCDSLNRCVLFQKLIRDSLLSLGFEPTL